MYQAAAIGELALTLEQLYVTNDSSTTPATNPMTLTHAKPVQVSSCFAIVLYFLLSNGILMLGPSRPVQAQAPLAADALIVVGAGGTDEYLDGFQRSADRWRMAFPESIRTTLVGFGPESADKSSADSSSDRQRILDWIAKEPDSATNERWIILIGHGTYQLNIAKFNLEGPDLSSEELAKAIAASQTPWRIIVCASCSGPFINALSAPNRIVVTATKSGSEQNYSRFGGFLSQSITASSSDLDHDGSVSVLEAFLVASRRVSDWYLEEGRLATEQALIDDNGDKRGTPASFFRGVRAAKAPADGLLVDGRIANRAYVHNRLDATGFTAEQQLMAADLERQIETLREQKSKLEEADYYAQLEALFLELAPLLIPSSLKSTSLETTSKTAP